jgi:hypothetical protein
VQDAQAGIQEAGHGPGQEARAAGQDQGQGRVHPGVDGHGRDGRAQGQTAVHGEVGEVQDPEGQIDAQDHEPEGEALFQGAEESIRGHGWMRFLNRVRRR